MEHYRLLPHSRFAAIVVSAPVAVVPVAEHLGTAEAVGFVFTSGALAYRSGAQDGNFQFTWFDRQGKILSAFGNPVRAGEFGYRWRGFRGRSSVAGVPGSGRNVWDVTSDGKRLLLASPQIQQTAQVPITVVVNWRAQLKK